MCARTKKVGESDNLPPGVLLGTELESVKIKAVMERRRHFCELDRNGYDLVAPFIAKRCR